MLCTAKWSHQLLSFAILHEVCVGHFPYTSVPIISHFGCSRHMTFAVSRYIAKRKLCTKKKKIKTTYNLNWGMQRLDLKQGMQLCRERVSV
jgi:hypothetical protein